MTNQKHIQEKEYSIPYHYIGKFEYDEFCPFIFDFWCINYLSTVEHLLSLLEGSSGKTFVDIGCGDGRLTREVAKRQMFKTIIGIDYSAKAIGLAQAMNTDLANIDWVCGDLVQARLQLNADVVVLMEVLEHIPIQEAASFLQAVRALMKPGGVLFLTVPHLNQPLETKHFRHFSVASLSEEIAQQRFRIETVKPFEKRGAMRRYLNRIISNRFVILRHPRMLKLVYKFYKKNLFFCDSELDCLRILLIARAV